MTATTQRKIDLRTPIKKALLGGAALGTVLMGAAGAARAAQERTVAHHKRHHAPARPAASPLAAEVAALKAEVATLSQRLDSATAAAQQAQAAAAQAQASARAAQSASRDVAQSEQAAINQIPADVDTAVARLPKPKTDAWYIKGVRFTPGGFIAAESGYRSRGLISDGATSPSFGNLPYFDTAAKAAHTAEWRASARQSRVSGLAEADVNPDIHLAGYGEFDFLGAAQTANSNESNSYNLRIRNLYATVDLKPWGLSFLAGQSWSLATLNDKGITPRNEMIPLTIDAQYTVGFVWDRQPQFRITENFGDGVWAALSAESSQTNSIGGQAALLPGVGGVVFNQLAGGGSLFNSANAYSFNHAPDVILKLAWDGPIGDRHLHVEGFGLYRNFYDRVGTGCNSSGANCTAFHNIDSSGGGGGFGVIAQVVPGRFDAQVSGLFGRGLGRYGTSQLPDVFEQADGSLAGVRQQFLLAGLILHAAPTFDIYGYLGQERAGRSSYTVGSAQGGYGDPLFSNLGGCEVPSVQLACNGNTQETQEATIGFWDRAYAGEFGSFRLGLQYSYVRRESFSGVVAGTAAAPTAFGQVRGDDNLVFTSIRYYPFQK